MHKRRTHKKKCKVLSESVLSGIVERMDIHEQVTRDIQEQLLEQKVILKLYYDTYLEMKKRNQKKYLLTYIRMRDEMLKDIERMKLRGKVNEDTFRLLSIYIEEYNTLLQDNGVEILVCRENDEFEPEFQKPIKRVDVNYAELDNKVVRVYEHGYMWEEIVLKKIQVAVGVYNK